MDAAEQLLAIEEIKQLKARYFRSHGHEGLGRVRGQCSRRTRCST